LESALEWGSESACGLESALVWASVLELVSVGESASVWG
jgi:hypothetical protein